MFSHFTRIHLTEQQRAQDMRHLKLLKSMSTGTQLTLSDLDPYLPLSRSDVSNPQHPSLDNSPSLTDGQPQPPPWEFAPILVASNKEGIDIVARKTLLFAAHNNTFAFRWKADVRRWQGCPSLPQEQLDVQNSDPCFWQYFVAGADAFLTNNLNTNLGLANGTPVKLHSLTFSSQDQLDAVLSDIASSHPGDVITLDEPPLAVNLLLPSTFDSKTTPSRRRTAQLNILKRHSLSKNDIVIPLPVMRGRTKLHACPVHSPSSL